MGDEAESKKHAEKVRDAVDATKKGAPKVYLPWNKAAEIELFLAELEEKPPALE